MGWFTTLFSASSIDNAVDAVIATGDKLVYTEEEKAEMRLKTGDLHIRMLGAYSAFKIAQRILAIWFALLYGFAFIVGLIVAIFNMITTYYQTMDGVAKDYIVTIPLDPLFALVTNFSMGMIMAIIVGFYFAGGSIESFKRLKK